jgi:hypothetical protein
MPVTPRRLLSGCLFVLVFLAGAAWGSGQHVAAQPVTPAILSGADIGFRMTARKGATPVGELVVRIDGAWQPVEFSGGLKLITK